MFKIASEASDPPTKVIASPTVMSRCTGLRLLRQVGEAQLQPALEEQQGNQESNQREQRVAEELLGLHEPCHVAREQAGRKQQQERGEPEQSADPLRADA
jgi:hypothetical protein